MGVAEEIAAVFKELQDKYKTDKTFAAELYTDDATLAVPGGEFIQGKAAIKAYYQNEASSGNMPAEPGTDTVVKIIELGPDFAQKIGYYSMTYKGAPTKFWYTTLMKKENGKWKFFVDTTGMTA